MPKLNALEELQVALDLAAREKPALPSRQAAKKFFADERVLIRPVEETWIIEEIARQIQQRRFKTKLTEDPQMSLLGFKPTNKLALPSGKQVATDEATLRKIQFSRRLAYKEHQGYQHPSIVKLDKMIALMEPHARKSPGITWGEVVKIEAAKKRKA